MPGGRRTPVDRMLQAAVHWRLRTGETRDLSMDEAVHRVAVISRRDVLRASALVGTGSVRLPLDVTDHERIEDSSAGGVRRRDETSQRLALHLVDDDTRHTRDHAVRGCCPDTLQLRVHGLGGRHVIEL